MTRNSAEQGDEQHEQRGRARWRSRGSGTGGGRAAGARSAAPSARRRRTSSSAGDEAGHGEGIGPPADRSLDDAEHERPDAEGREDGAHRVEADVLGRPGVGHEGERWRRRSPPRRRRSRRRSTATSGCRAASPRRACRACRRHRRSRPRCPTARARSSGGNTLVIVERVPGMISAPPMPVSARKAMSWPPESAKAESSEPAPKSTMPTSERAPAAVAVAEGAGDEEQRRQRERVGVGHPGEAGLAEAEVLADRGQADGQHRHAGDDEHQGEAHGDQHQRALPRASSGASGGSGGSVRGVRVRSLPSWRFLRRGARAVSAVRPAGWRDRGRTRRGAGVAGRLGVPVHHASSPNESQRYR